MSVSLNLVVFVERSRYIHSTDKESSLNFTTRGDFLYIQSLKYSVMSVRLDNVIIPTVIMYGVDR